MIVTISGLIGSGKTTVAKAIAKRFNLRHVSAGEAFRELAKERGLSLLEFSKLAERDKNIDIELDKKIVELAKAGNVVVDGRLSGWLIKDADLRVFLKAPLEVRVKRVCKRENKNYDTALKEIVEREKSEAKRYKEIYGIDIKNIEIYDIVLNTALWQAEDVIEIIATAIEKLK